MSEHHARDFHLEEDVTKGMTCSCSRGKREQARQRSGAESSFHPNDAKLHDCA